MDIKTELIQPLPPFQDNTVTTVLSETGRDIYQGFIASPPKQAIFLSLISAIVRSGPEPPYGLFIVEFMRFIRKDAELNYNRLKEGNTKGKLHNYLLFQEICTKKASDCKDGLDRYGKCCNITRNGQRIIKTRYADFGKNW